MGLLIQSYTPFRVFRKVSGTIFSTIFYVLFFQKSISHVNSIKWPNLIFWLPWCLGILGNMCFVITFNYLLSYQAIFLHDQKVSRMKGGFKLKLEMFFIIFKELSVARNSLRLEFVFNYYCGHYIDSYFNEKVSLFLFCSYNKVLDKNKRK